MTDSLPPNPPPPGAPPATPPTSPMPVADAELHAYADRQLTTERAAEVEAWLARRPDEAARVRAWNDQKHDLRAMFDPVLDEAVPSALRQTARRRAAWYRQPIAAGIALAVVAGGAGWTLRGLDDRALLAAATSTSTSTSTAREAIAGTEFATRAAIAHAVYTPEVRRPVEVDAEHEDQLVTWLSKRMGTTMKAPHLQSVGYALEGGRLLPGNRGPVAQFMYRDEAGHRLTLYVSNETTGATSKAAGGLGASAVATPAASHANPGADSHEASASGPDIAFRFLREGKVNVFYWVDGPFRYALTAAADRPTLSRVSEEVFRQLDPARP